MSVLHAKYKCDFIRIQATAKFKHWLPYGVTKRKRHWLALPSPWALSANSMGIVADIYMEKCKCNVHIKSECPSANTSLKCPFLVCEFGKGESLWISLFMDGSCQTMSHRFKSLQHFWSTFWKVLLCVAIFFWLSYVN